jgi:uncharacterized protein with HEPN domain
MMLIAIGESLKNLDKVTGGTLFSRYPEVDWKGAKGIRDIIVIIIFISMPRWFSLSVRKGFQDWYVL